MESKPKGSKDPAGVSEWEFWQAAAAEPDYYRARSADEAVGLLAEYGGKAILVAGALDVLSLIKSLTQAPRTLISLRDAQGLNFIRSQSGALSLGAATTLDQISRSPLIESIHPALREAAASVGSPQVRNRATLAGDLCQQVRCWYYRRSPDTGIVYPCARKQEEGLCYARAGQNQYHAIFPAHVCCAVCPSDLATVLLALDACLRVRSVWGERQLGIDQLYSPLGLALEPGELILSLEVPADRSTSITEKFIKFRTRQAIDFATVSVAVRLVVDHNQVRESRIVLGGVSYAPYRARRAEAILAGKALDEVVAEHAAAEALADAVPLSQNGYKVAIARALVKRAILSQSD